MLPPIDYFAFVESIDELGPPSEDISPLVDARELGGHTRPTHAVWLDCVDETYFMDLPWRSKPCEINNSDHAKQRRKDLAALDDARFRAVLLLIDESSEREEERTAFDRFSESDWHRIRIQDDGGLPVFIGPDFDLAPDGTQLRYVHYRDACEDDQLRSLRNVFSLNFLPDARFDSDNNGGGATPTCIGPRDRGPEGLLSDGRKTRWPNVTRYQLLKMEHAVYRSGQQSPLLANLHKTS